MHVHCVAAKASPKYRHVFDYVIPVPSVFLSFGTRGVPDTCILCLFLTWTFCESTILEDSVRNPVEIA